MGENHADNPEQTSHEGQPENTGLSDGELNAAVISGLEKHLRRNLRGLHQSDEYAED